MATLPYNPDPWNTPDVAVSPLSVKTYFPNGPKIGTWAELWFGSASHLDPGYKSNDPDVVAAQVAAIKARGFDFVILDWYGFNVQPQHAAALMWRSECEKQGLQFCLDFNKGIFQFGVPAGSDLPAYGRQQMWDAAANFFASPAYMKHTDGRALLLNWDCQSVAGLDCAKVFGMLPNVAVLYEHAGGVSKPASAGCFGWIGLPDPLAYHADFLAAAAKAKAANPKTIVMASLCKGFDDHGRRPGTDAAKSCWNQAQPYRFVDERQGQTFLDMVAATKTSAVDYIFVATHNDYEENTAIAERGIDSQLAVSLSVADGVLTAALTGNLNTVDHIEFWVNGALVSSIPPASIDTLVLAPPASGKMLFACDVVAVGRALFQNKLSNVVSTTATVVPAQTAVIRWGGSIDVPLPATAAVKIDADLGQFHVSGTVNVPLPATQTVAVEDQLVTVTIADAMVVWS